MRILVTGGAGFQGSNLCQSLLSAGYDVTILNTLSQTAESNINKFGLGNARIIWGSVTDSESITKSVREHDSVFHLAANIHVDDSRKNSYRYVESNIVGTHNVADACRRNGISLIYVSTCEVYGGCNRCSFLNSCLLSGIAEHCPMKPQSPYAASKAGGDNIVFGHAVTYGTPTTILRPGNVFGNGQRSGARGAVIPIMLAKAIAEVPIEIYGSGEQTRDFIYIKDLVRAYTLVIDQIARSKWGNPPNIFNIGTGVETSILSVAHSVVKITESKSVIRHVKSRPGEVSSFCLDSTRIRHLGFMPQYDFSSALKHYVQQHYSVST